MKQKLFSRNTDVDVMKGLAIVAVVIGHSFYVGDVVRTVYLFHLPLFFFVAGYVFNPEKYIGRSDKLIERSAKRLLLPCAVMSLVVYPLSFWFTPDVLSVIYGVGIPVKLRLSGLVFVIAPLLLMMWFLYCLFVLRVFLLGFVWLTEKLKTPVWCNAISSFVIACVGIKIGQIIPLPWSIDLALVGLFFAYAGYVHHRRWLPLRSSHYWACGLGAVCLALAVADYMYGGLDLNARYYRAPVLDLFGALGIIHLIVCVIQWSKHCAIKWLRRLRFLLSYLGLNSLVIMFVHIMVLEGKTGWGLVCLRLMVCIVVAELLARNDVLRSIFSAWRFKDARSVFDS